MGAVQSRAWRTAYNRLIPAETLAAFTPEALEQPWRRAITEPPSPAHHVFVACEESTVVGFAAAADIEIATLVVDPLHQRRGHGSRMLAALTDTLREQHATRVQMWVPEADDVLLAFLASAGMVPDGARRSYPGPAAAGDPDGADEVVELRTAARLD